MATDQGTDVVGSRERSAWRRFLVRAQAFEAAMSISYDEVQDRRLLALEREVMRLRGIVEADRISGRSDTDADP